MIGTGYVGLVSGTCFAELGYHVTCVDVDAEKIRLLEQEGIIPIFEPGLKELVDKNVMAGRLAFTTDLATCVPGSDAVFIAVGTPQDEDGSADLKYVETAARQIASHLQGYTVIVNKSTVPVGTGIRVDALMREVAPDAAFDVVSNPEFLREGEAVEDFMKPDRVIVGVETPRAEAMMRAFYKPFTDQNYPLLVVNRASSELIKYASNAFLATKITFINEMIALCDAVGADVLSVSKGMGMDSRIAPRFLQPGPGYGGSCFPKDTHALAKTARDHGVVLSLVEETIAANQRIKESMVGRIEKALGGNVAGKRIAILGLAFKANTDDMRDASALTIIPALKAKGADIVAFDPEAMPRAKELLLGQAREGVLGQLAGADGGFVEKTSGALNFASVMDDGLFAGADATVVLTDWSDFRSLDLAHMAETMRGKDLIDLRNLYVPADVTEAGLVYHPLGRPTA